MRDIPFERYDGETPSPFAVYRPAGIGLAGVNAAELGVAHFANITQSIADTAGFIPQIWAQRALDIFRANIILARLVARDTDYEPAWQGKTLNIPYPGTFVAQSKTANTPATVQTPTGGTSVPVTLSSHQYVDFLLEDVARATSLQGTDLLDRYIEGPVIALAEKVETDLFALYSTLSTTVGTSGTDATAGTVRSARKALNDAKVPQAGRALVISTKDEISLQADSTLQNFFAFANPAAVAEGALGDLYGLRTFTSTMVPTVAGTPVSTKCLAFSRSAFIFASRPFAPAPVGSGVKESNIVDPLSGLAIRFQVWYSMADRAIRAGFDILYGVAGLRAAAGVIVLT